MMNSESMADMLRAAMQKRQGGKNSFTMTGQYAGAVEREGDREYVMYESPNGEQVKVYGNWNEYAVSRDEQGRDMIADEDYPIVQNEDGEYVLDEVRHNENMDTAYEREPVERMARETAEESTQGASKMENLLEKLRDHRGPRQLPGRFEQGGKIPQGGKKPFKMIGQYADAVQTESGPEGSRQYVMYLTDDFKTKVKVYGNWNDYSIGQWDDSTPDYIPDEDYPIIVNEKGEYVLDEPRFKEQMDNMAELQPVLEMKNVTEYETYGQDNRTKSLLEKLNKERGQRRFEEGGKVPGDKVGKMKKAIVRMLEGGASDKEINAAIEKSGLDSSYDFEWDNVQMTVTAKPKDGERFGPKDEGGQRGDMFKYGGLMSKLKKYDQGGATSPQPPEWISSDPRFSNIKFVGKDKEQEFNRAQGSGGREFRFDLKGVKFYGFEDDGFTFIDSEGNAFTADRDYSTGNPDDEGGGYDDIFNYLKDLGAEYSDEYAQKMKFENKLKRDFAGPFGGQGASKTEDLLERLRDVRRRR